MNVNRKWQASYPCNASSFCRTYNAICNVKMPAMILC